MDRERMLGLRPILVMLPVTSLLLLTGVLFSQEGDDEEVEERNESRLAAPTDSLSAMIQQAVYATIDSGFQSMKPIFQRSCFDCHSQNTVLPWYAKLPLVEGFLNNHIKEARKELDMTNGFPFTGKDEPVKMLRKMREEIDEGGMPLWSYRLMHWGTKIEGTRKDSVFAWIDSSITRLEKLHR